MERGFHHPRGMYHRRNDGPWFTGADMPHENSWAGRPFPQCSQDYHSPWQGRGPPAPQWDHPKPWWGQDHQNSQCYPAPQWNHYHPECPSWDYDCGFDNGNFPYQGSSSYRRRSHGKFYGKRSSSFYKGKGSSHNLSRVLVETQQRKKENDSEVKEDKSAKPKETKQAQKEPVALVKNSDPPQASQEASKAIISPSEFSFHLSPDSTCPIASSAKSEDTELINLGTGSKTEDSHQVAFCIQTATSELPAPLENPELKKEEEGTEQDKLKGTQAQPSQAVFLPSAEALMEGQAPSNIAGSFDPVVKEEPVLAIEAHRNLVASPASAEAPTETMKDSYPVVKEEPLESSQPTDHFNHVDSPPAVEIPFLSDTTDECQSEGKKDLELNEIGGSHEDTDCCQARHALAGGSSALPVIPSDLHSVPVLVNGKVTEQVLSCSSFHSCYSCDRNPDTGGVLECRSSPNWNNSDSKHSSTQRTITCLRSPLRQGHHSRLPVRQRQPSRSPLREREITRIYCCSKCHCKCCQNPSQERFQERELPHSYSADKMHLCQLSKETSKCYRTSHFCYPENSMVAQLAHSSEDTGFPHQPCSRKETGTSTPSKIVEDPRSVAVLTRRNQIEQDYLQVILNFAVVATMLLQKEPCMEQALEVALRAIMRSAGDYFESMLKNFIDHYDLSETKRHEKLSFNYLE